MSDLQLYCAACEKDVHPDIVSGARIYPHRTDLRRRRFARCRRCLNYVGLDPRRTGGPVVIPTPAMRSLRIRIHAAIDDIWKSKALTRTQVYERMSKAINVEEFHAGSLRSLEEARRALDAAIALHREVRGRPAHEVHG